MKTSSGFIICAILALCWLVGCARQDAPIVVIDPHGVLAFSRETPDSPAARLSLIEVRQDGTAVFRYNTQAPHVVYGKPGEELHSEFGTASAYKVISTSFEKQTVRIQFRDIYPGKGKV